MRQITNKTINEVLCNTFHKNKNAYFLKFTAPWCGSTSLDIQLNNVEILYPSIEFCEVNCDNPNSQLMVHDYNIRNLPTCILFDKRGNIIKRYGSNVSGVEIKNDLINYK